MAEAARPIMRFMQNYEGPGIYEHYKGGTYVVVGKVRLEWNEGEGVAYMTTDPEHREEQFYKDFMFTIRPLDFDDCCQGMSDPWNTCVIVDGVEVPRFKKIA